MKKINISYFMSHDYKYAKESGSSLTTAALGCFPVKDDWL